MNTETEIGIVALVAIVLVIGMVCAYIAIMNPSEITKDQNVSKMKSIIRYDDCIMVGFGIVSIVGILYAVARR